MRCLISVTSLCLRHSLITSQRPELEIPIRFPYSYSSKKIPFKTDVILGAKVHVEEKKILYK